MMKTLEDHKNNLVKKNLSFIEDNLVLIYEMINYELYGTSSFLQNLNNAISKVLDQNIPCERIEMNFNTFKKFRNEDIKSFDPITDPVILKTGKYGKIWDVDIYINRNLKDDEMIGFTEARFQKEIKKE